MKVIHSLDQLDFGQLMQVYEEGNRENGADLYPSLSAAEQLLAAEQDFYAFLKGFFRVRNAKYFVLIRNHSYVSALRLEPFQDGLLLEALETKPDQRGNGFAKELISAMQASLRKRGHVKLYSHIHKKNIPSLAAHKACGFQRILDHAVYVDGSVLSSSCTMLWES